MSMYCIWFEELIRKSSILACSLSSFVSLIYHSYSDKAVDCTCWKTREVRALRVCCILSYFECHWSYLHRLIEFWHIWWNIIINNKTSFALFNWRLFSLVGQLLQLCNCATMDIISVALLGRSCGTIGNILPSCLGN